MKGQERGETTVQTECEVVENSMNKPIFWQYAFIKEDRR